jgi:predicted ATP-dependent serine protease
MRRLERVVRQLDRNAAVVPVPFASWADAHVSLRRGEVSMIAGPPGAGKSTVALAVALQSGVPTLYASCDSHESTMALRLISMINDIPQSEVEDRMHDTTWASQVIASKGKHIAWMMDSNPSLRDLEDQINLYRVLKGSDPQLVVIDNAVDFTHESGDEFSSLRSLMREIKWWSRDTGAAFLVLHHTSEHYEGNPCPPRASLHGKIAQVPSLIMTIAAHSHYLMLCAVKNRYGPADPSGGKAFYMEYDPSRMLLRDPR